jgi:hypothetical protein
MLRQRNDARLAMPIAAHTSTIAGAAKSSAARIQKVAVRAATGLSSEQFETQDNHRHLWRMSEDFEFDPADYSVVVKRRGNPPKPWRWEIYRAGKNDPVERSAVFFESMAEALKEGKKALAHFLAQRAA